MQARLTLIGIENYLNNQSKSIVDSFTLDDIESYDNQTLLFTIINTGGIFEVVYADPDYFYSACSLFWSKWKYNFSKLFTAFESEYNPVENYDRVEEWHEDIVDAGTSTSTDSRAYNSNEVVGEESSNTSDSTNTSSNTSNSNSTTVNEVSAFDESGYNNHDRSTDNSGSVEVGTNTSADSNSGTIDRTTTSSYTDANVNNSDNSNDRDLDHTGHIHGNIGTVSAMELLEQEVKLRAKNNLYQIMADTFLREMTLRVF